MEPFHAVEQLLLNKESRRLKVADVMKLKCAAGCDSMAAEVGTPLSYCGVTYTAMMQVTAVREDELDLSNGEVLTYGVCLWSAGNCSRDITRQVFDQLQDAATFRAPRPEMQKLPVDNYMRIVGVQNAYAAGDCSRIVAAPLPPTAQVWPQHACLLCSWCWSGCVSSQAQHGGAVAGGRAAGRVHCTHHQPESCAWDWWW